MTVTFDLSDATVMIKGCYVIQDERQSCFLSILVILFVLSF